ncbi:MAG: Ohr family peroxiredoxin [Luteolibacter sp.]
MKTLFTSEAISKGGRSGTVQSPDGLLDLTLGNPLESGIETRGPNPELLFAGAYSACYHGALANAAKKLGSPLQDSTVRVIVSLVEDDEGGYGLAVELHALLPNINPDQAHLIMEQAHLTCPYSKALRGQAPVVLVVDNHLPDLPVNEEKNLGRDLDLIDELPTKTQELTTLMDASEKTTGEERAAITQDIRDHVSQTVSEES